jgi:hypothetical protein
MSATAPEHETPPVGEEIHLPGPSALPIFNALGITLAIIGITLGLLFVIVGVAIFLFTTVRWIASTRRDISELPPDHTAH